MTEIQKEKSLGLEYQLIAEVREVFLRKGYLGQGLKEVKELVIGKAGDRGNSTGKPPETGSCLAIRRKEAGVARAEENGEQERDEMGSYKESCRTVGTHQALEQRGPSSVTGVAFRRLWSTHPA